jgi:hypothetical protein
VVPRAGPDAVAKRKKSHRCLGLRPRKEPPVHIGWEAGYFSNKPITVTVDGSLLNQYTLETIVTHLDTGILLNRVIYSKNFQKCCCRCYGCLAESRVFKIQ